MSKIHQMSLIKKEYNFGSITLQGFGPNYNLRKKYKTLILVTIYQN